MGGIDRWLVARGKLVDVMMGCFNRTPNIILGKAAECIMCYCGKKVFRAAKIFITSKVFVDFRCVF